MCQKESIIWHNVVACLVLVLVYVYNCVQLCASWLQLASDQSGKAASNWKSCWANNWQTFTCALVQIWGQVQQQQHIKMETHFSILIIPLANWSEWNRVRPMERETVCGGTMQRNTMELDERKLGQRRDEINSNCWLLLLLIESGSLNLSLG